MRALITGAAGQDGHFLAELMTERGWDVVSTSLSETDFAPDHAAWRGQVAQLDVMDPSAISKMLSESRTDAVFHLAGLSSVGGSWADPSAYLSVNVGGTANVVLAADAIRLTGGEAPHVIIASSAEVFAEDAPLPFTEATPIGPLNPYGVSKAAAQFFGQTYRARGVPVSCAILFNHESHLRPATFVTGKIVRGVARIGAGLADHLTLGNLDARRDWLHASDVAAAMIAIADQRAVDDFVIAGGVSRSVADFVAAAFASVGIEDWRGFVRVDQALLRATDAPELRGDSSHLRAVAGWTPRRDFAEWVGEMVALAPLEN